MTPVHRLVLEPLEEGTWRLCDQAAASSDAESVVAYVERRRDGQYEVTWVVSGIGGYLFASTVEILRAATAGLRPRIRSQAVKPIPIAHRPPLAAGWPSV